MTTSQSKGLFWAGLFAVVIALGYGLSSCSIRTAAASNLKSSRHTFRQEMSTGMSVSAFQGTPRFEILSRLGAGGMGVVYEAFDRERQTRVALKALPRIEAGSLYRFKQEFRALADLVHPNLATLHELIEYQGTWFFTMELVDGTDFLRYVRGTVTVQPTHFRGSRPLHLALDPSAPTLLSPASEDTPVEGTPGPPIDLSRWSPLAEADQFERCAGPWPSWPTD